MSSGVSFPSDQLPVFELHYPPPEYKACWIIQLVDVSPLAVAFYPDDCTYGRDVSWARGRVVCAIMSIFACKLSMVCPYGCYFS